MTLDTYTQRKDELWKEINNSSACFEDKVKSMQIRALRDIGDGIFLLVERLDKICNNLDKIAIVMPPSNVIDAATKT